MKEIIICIGISGSGKSTWTTNFIKENSNYLRINRDSIRLTLVGNLDGYYQRKDLNYIERDVTRLEDEFYKHLSLSGFNIIIDNTNLTEKYINRWINLSNCLKLDARINLKFKLFDITLEEAKENVINREDYYTPALTPHYKYHQDKVEYIDKQFEQYKQIKKFIEENYKDKII